MFTFDNEENIMREIARDRNHGILSWLRYYTFINTDAGPCPGGKEETVLHSS